MQQPEGAVTSPFVDVSTVSDAQDGRAGASSSLEEQQPRLPPVRTGGRGPSPSNLPFAAAAPAAEGSDNWTSAGPFRAAPMLYVMHSTPSGTPLASPRDLPSAEDGTADDLEAPLLPRPSKRHNQHFTSGGALRAIVFGLINTAAGVPALIAFCAVVFKHPLYAPWVEPLARFFYLASALHQAVVLLRSAVPNAVGQVQDVGLIFLSGMASSIAVLCTQAGLDAAAALGTALLTMAASTALVGLGLIAVAKLQLAVVVQYLPLPAVGGYLSFVGYFCFASGLGLGCGIQLGTIASWAQLWDAQVALRVLPTLASTGLMMWTMKRTQHPLALPGVLLVIVATFHAVLLVAGISLQDAQEAGWVLKPAAGSGRFWDLWRLFDMPGLSLDHIYFPAILQQVGKLLGLFLLVCFGSCMDIAAIQQDTPFRLDFNSELTTIGVSNMVAGMVGCGFTGSFIFSQTIFTGRAGVHSRLNGAVIAACELAMFALPIPLVAYLPTFFFGSLLVWFGVEIVLDWMVRSYWKLSRTEYALLWATFAAIMRWDLEAGIAAGIVLATCYFAWAYAQSQLSSFALVPGRSGIVRPADQEAALELLRPAHMATAQLRGYLFFGVANGISTRLHAAAKQLDASAAAAAAAGEGGVAGDSEGEAASGRRRQAPLLLPQQAADRLYAGGSKHGGALYALATAPRFLLLDFSRVKGIDATAARTLGGLFRDLAQLDITPVVTAAHHRSIRQLLAAHGVALPAAPLGSAEEAVACARTSAAEGGGPAAAAAAAPPPSVPTASVHCQEFGSYEEGLRFCEQQLLAVAVRAGLCRAPSDPVTLEQLLRSHTSQAALPFASKEASGELAAAILQYAIQQRYRPGERLWSEGQPADELFIIEQGRVTVEQQVQREQQQLGDVLPEAAVAVAAAASPSGVNNRRQAQGPSCSSPAGSSSSGSSSGGGGGSGSRGATRLFEFSPGCIAGAVDFYLHRPRSSTAVVSRSGSGGSSSSGGCRVLLLTREALGRMAADAPAALHVLQAVVLRAKCLDLGTAAELALSQSQS